MIMAAEALLRSNPTPTDREIRTALSGNLCRCTGYVKLIESVKAAEDVISPVGGEVIEVNSALEATPEIVNESPYETWFYRVKPTGKIDAELAALLSPDDYDKHMEESAAAH